MHQRYRIAIGVIAVLVIPSGHAASSTILVDRNQPGVWRIDSQHSAVSFRIRNFVTKVQGRFADLRGTIAADPQAWGDAGR